MKKIIIISICFLLFNCNKPKDSPIMNVIKDNNLKAENLNEIPGNYDIDHEPSQKRKETIYDQKYYVNNIDNKYMGIYLPKYFIESIENTRNFGTALTLNSYRDNSKHDGFYYDILIVQENNIFSSLAFYDGYAIYAENIKHFEFIDNNQQMAIIDDNGHPYIKISELKYDYYIIVSNYIGKIIFSDLIENGKIIIADDTIKVLPLNLDFEIVCAWPVDEANLELFGMNREPFALKIENGSYNFYKIRYLDNLNSEIIDEIVYQIR
jgi:hypothetical protein